MISDFDLVPILHLVGIFIHVYPIELRGAGADGRDEAFALPAPIMLGVGKVVAREGVAGGVFEFQVIFQGDVEVLGYLDVELEGECEWVRCAFRRCFVTERDVEGAPCDFSAPPCLH